MEDKKSVKVSLGTTICIFIIFLLIIGIVVMYYFGFVKNNGKISVLKDQVNVLSNKNTIQSEKEEIKTDDVNNISSKTQAETQTDNSKNLDDNQVRIIIEDYLRLYGASRCDGLLGLLEEKGILKKINYTHLSEDSALLITSLKFSDYKEAMLRFVSEKLFEKEFKEEPVYEYVNSDGYIVKSQGGGGNFGWDIYSITKNSNLNYTAKAFYYIDGDWGYNETITFTLKSYNNNYVIDTIDIVKN